MTGETDLGKLLKELKPELNPGEYVFCTVNTLGNAAELDPLCIFQEKEEVTVIIPKVKADETVLFYPVVCAWITLTVHSSLEAVGLTAAVSHALTEANISCNIVAAYHHDHLFVPIRDTERAMEVLKRLSQ
jgi:hypothetical protein